MSLILLVALSSALGWACTGIRLRAEDGGAVYGRTMEWGAFDLNSRVVVFPRNHRFRGTTPEGANGKTWRGKYGIVALDMLEKDLIADGMNEEGLSAGLFYHPGFAEYAEYDVTMKSKTISAVDMCAYVLSQFATVQQVREGIKNLVMVPVVEEALGIPVEAHWIVNDARGNSIIIEAYQGELRVFKNSLGVVTNAPNFDWHITNLRNYRNLSMVALPQKELEDLDFSPIGAGSGMMGLPGDHTPPSRFIRAVAWSQSARPTMTSGETVYELFRILDNFNLPLGVAEGGENSHTNLEGMRSSTLWTTAWDMNERVLYYHTQHNRRVRMLNFDDVDFGMRDVQRFVLDEHKEQDVLNLLTR